MLPGRRHRRQRQAFLISLLAVVKLHHVDVQPRVGGEAEPDTDLTQQAGDKVQSFSPYCITCSRRGYSLVSEQKILAAHAGALAQDFP